MDLKGNVAMITGGAGGIGYSIAKRFVGSNGRVAIADVDEDKAQHAACQLGDQAIAVQMDVTSEESTNEGVEAIIQHWERIDILVCNAAIHIAHPLEDFPYAEWKKLLATHLDGAFLATRACIPHMYRRGSGTLLYLGSVQSKEASSHKSAYVTAKQGLLGLTRTMALEGAEHGVRANLICPGFVGTPLVKREIPEQDKQLGISEDQIRDDVALGGNVDKTFDKTSDVAEVALFLASFPSNALTGQPIVVSHGWRMS